MGWTEPRPDALYDILDKDNVTILKRVTYAELVSGIDPDLLPADDVDYETLLWSFNAVPVGETIRPDDSRF